MDRLRSIARIGLALGLATLGMGGLMVAGAALIAGDWWLAQQPWIGLGLNLLIIGLAATAIFAALRVLVEPIGWLRVLAVPPALFVVSMWWFLLAVGYPTTRGPRPEIATLLYSVPWLIVIAVVATLLLVLPLAIARLRRSRSGLAISTSAPAPR